MKRYAIPLLFISLGACANMPVEKAVPVAPDPYASLSATIESRCDDGSFSGVVLVSAQGRTIFEKACSPDREPSDGDLYKIFSTSKTMTGMAILALVNRGRLDLDTPITAYLENAPEAWSSVTIRSLLHHNSGIPDLTNDLLEQFTKHDALSHYDAMDAVIAAQASAETAIPGGKFAYSNFGYELLAQIAAKREGTSFDKILKSLVFEPAGMNATVIALPKQEGDEVTGSQDVPALVAGYNGEPGKLEEATSYSFVQLGAGAVLSSARDMTLFSRAMDNDRIVSGALFSDSLDDALRVNDNVAYGPGVMLRNTNGCRVLQHSGGTNGYVSDLSRVPGLKASVVVLSNYGFANVRDLSTRALDILTANSECATAE